MNLPRAAVLALLASAGCLADDTEVCLDGTLCPSGQACAPMGGCAQPGQVHACTGLADEAPCTWVGIGTGSCAGGMCIVPRCGNARVEGEEVCDDGNANDGDGCARDCASDETCGNGVRDAGEGCDDGNADDGDGCQAGCVLPRCGDGVTDPDEACDDGNLASGDGCAGTCISIEACGNGILDVSEVCDDGNLVDGDSCQATCLPPRCGDGVLDGEETCDDGNVVPGDGCMFDCSSDERCGNGVLDLFAGERCDDANVISYDGCSARCAPDVPPTWTDRGAPPRIDCSAFDTARGRLVVFATPVGAATGETWEWDGTTWMRRSPATLPPARRQCAMAYEPARARIVLFGGTDGAQDLGDTWEWNGVAWRRVEPLRRPPGRNQAAMAYDPVRRSTVMFGGRELNDVFGDTWTYRWEGDPEEACSSGRDLDGDTLVGCDDPDCWAVCTPFCPPGEACDPGAPRCGDATCSEIEDCRACPADCGPCTPACGDDRCDPGEDAAACAGDCEV